MNKRITIIVLSVFVSTASVIVPPAFGDAKPDYQLNIDWEWRDFSSPPSSDAWTFVVKDGPPPVVREKTSAHGCVVNAINAANNKDTATALRWLLAGQSDRRQASAYQSIETAGNMAVDYAVKTYGGSVPTQPTTPVGSDPNSVPYYDFLTFGVGLPAVSINLGNGSFGYLDSISPITVMWFPVWAQSVVRTGVDSWTRVAWWGLSLGLIFSKPQSASSVQFGFDLVPAIIKFGPISLGVGVRWEDTGSFSLDSTNWSIVVPATYTLSP